MAATSVSSTAAADSAGWKVQGRDGQWFAEKAVRGGKLLACAALSADLFTPITELEQFHGRLGKNSPTHQDFKGNNNS